MAITKKAIILKEEKLAREKELLKERAAFYAEAMIDELYAAKSKFKPFASGHEAYGVIKEEFEEFWEAIRTNNLDKAGEELIQVGAMALRYLVERPGTGKIG